jgi:hypothetical protein
MLVCSLEEVATTSASYLVVTSTTNEPFSTLVRSEQDVVGQSSINEIDPDQFVPSFGDRDLAREVDSQGRVQPGVRDLDLWVGSAGARSRTAIDDVIATARDELGEAVEVRIRWWFRNQLVSPAAARGVFEFMVAFSRRDAVGS